MTDFPTVGSVTVPQAVDRSASVTPVAPVAHASSGSASSSDAASTPSKPPALTVDVSRDSTGVFIYTVRDPATDVVLTVIPRREVSIGGGAGRKVDQRV